MFAQFTFTELVQPIAEQLVEGRMPTTCHLTPAADGFLMGTESDIFHEHYFSAQGTWCQAGNSMENGALWRGVVIGRRSFELGFFVELGEEDEVTVAGR